MPTFAQNVLPNNTGYDLGSPSQKWDGFFQNLVVDSLTVNGTTAASGVSTVAYSATPAFDVSTNHGQKITLTGDVSSSTATGGSAGTFYVFQVTQDGTGGRAFVWPTSFKGAVEVDTTASTSTTQIFWYDGTNYIGFAATVTS